MLLLVEEFEEAIVGWLSKSCFSWTRYFKKIIQNVEFVKNKNKNKKNGKIINQKVHLFKGNVYAYHKYDLFSLRELILRYVFSFSNDETKMI